MTPKINARLKTILLLAVFVTICGCARNSQVTQSTTHLVPTTPMAMVPPQPKAVSAVDHEGSLWRENGLFSDMFKDAKAWKVGDIVTIRILESSSATNKANTKTGRASSLEAGIDTLFGLEDWY